jgi:hypothetical protein
MSNHAQPEQHAGGEEFLLRLRALPSGYAPIGRLKRALKALLRTFELRCVEVSDVTPKLPPLPGVPRQKCRLTRWGTKSILPTNRTETRDRGCNAKFGEGVQ